MSPTASMAVSELMFPRKKPVMIATGGVCDRQPDRQAIFNWSMISKSTRARAVENQPGEAASGSSIQLSSKSHLL